MNLRSTVAGWLMLGATVVTPVFGQAGMRVLRPTPCPAVAALTSSSEVRPEKLREVLVVTGPAGATLSSLPSDLKLRGSAVRDILGAVEMSGPPPAPMPVLVLQLHVIDAVERPIDQRQLLLTLGDSSRIDLGSMNAYRLRPSSSRKVEENLTARIPPMQFRALARTTSAQVTLGNDSFSLTAEQLNDLRSLYAAAVCGGRFK